MGNYNKLSVFNINKVKFPLMPPEIKIATPPKLDHSHLRRLKTIGSHLDISAQQQRNNDSVRTRMKTLISRTNGFMTPTAEPTEMHNVNTSESKAVESPAKTVADRDKYEEENENLTTDFASDWSRMENTKRETYSRLRNKLVQKFPSYRQRYKKQQIDTLNQNQQPIKQHYSSQRSHTRQERQRNASHSFTATPVKIVTGPNVFKTACFYSRSQKKCMYNSFVQQEAIQENIELPLPKMSFMSYIKDHKQLHQLKSRKIKGLNLMRAKEKLLKFQKQGTQSYNNLKKCLEESIDACMRVK